MVKIVPLKEFSLSRVVSHLQTIGFATISPYRYENSTQENNNLFIQMMHEISGAGYGFFKVTGRYVDSKTQVESEERSFLIPDKPIPSKHTVPLKELMVQLMRQYKQDSVLWVENGQAYFLYQNGREEKIGQWNTGRFNNYMTILKKKNDKEGNPEHSYYFDVEESHIEQAGNVNEIMLYKKLHIYDGLLIQDGEVKDLHLM